MAAFSCFCDFQMFTFNKQDQKSNEELLLLFFIPFLLIGYMMLCYISSHLSKFHLRQITLLTQLYIPLDIYIYTQNNLI